MLHTPSKEIPTSIVSSAVAMFVGESISLVGVLVGGDIGQILEKVGGPTLLVFWAGIMLGWTLRGKRIKRDRDNGTKPDRPA